VRDHVEQAVAGDRGIKAGLTRILYNFAAEVTRDVTRGAVWMVL
jgi:hypothetical protein